MIKAIFPSGLNEIKLPAVYQWDYNRKLSIEGISTTGSVLQVHFSNEFSRVAIPRVAYKSGSEWQVNIPNVLLQDKYTIYAYIFLNDAESGKVEKKIVIPVKARPMPDDYPQNSYEDAELNRLIDYTNKLGGQVSRYANILADYQSKKWVKPITKAEYNALVDAGTIEDDVLYCFTDVSLSDSIAESLETEVIESVKQGIQDGSITIGMTEADGIKAEVVHNTEVANGSFLDFAIENGYRYVVEIKASSKSYPFIGIAANGEIRLFTVGGVVASINSVGALCVNIETRVDTDSVKKAYYESCRQIEFNNGAYPVVSKVNYTLAKVVKLDKVL